MSDDLPIGLPALRETSRYLRKRGFEYDSALVAAAADTIEALQQRCAELELRLDLAKFVCAEQAEDERLWFIAEHITEDTLQKALRRLHEAVEGITSQECAVAALTSSEGAGECTCQWGQVGVRPFVQPEDCPIHSPASAAEDREDG